jgi:tRNA(fMet)-specific endonuclease VapC
MKPSLIDTDILSMFFRGDQKVGVRFDAYIQEHQKITFSIISYYEVGSGLKHRDAQKQLDKFLEFAQYGAILPLTEHSALISAEIYADLRRKGMPIDDIDVLIAGIAKANNLVVVTRNQGHFRRIEGLEVEDWSRS